MAAALLMKMMKMMVYKNVCDESVLRSSSERSGRSYGKSWIGWTPLQRRS